MVGRALVAALAASTALAHAEPLRTLHIEVTAVRALDSGPSDPELVALRPRLRRLAGYRAYQVVTHEARNCDWRSESHFLIPGGRELQLLPKGYDDDVVKMEVRLLEGRRRLVDTNLQVMRGGTMMFGVGRDKRIADEAQIILLKAEMP
jgi:hypothetical protein